MGKIKFEGIENFFENIDTQEKAYFLGLIIADGSIVKDTPQSKTKTQNKLSISLKDKEILERMRDIIVPNKNITVYKAKGEDKAHWSIKYTLKIHSNRMCEDLERHGVFSKKTGNEIFPDIENSLYPHLIRGYFDGDGCCYVKLTNKKSKTGGNLKNIVVFVCLNELFLIKLREKLNNIGKVTKTIRSDGRKDVYRYCIENIPETSLYFKYTYTDARIYMKRKHDKFLQGNPVLTDILTGISSVETTN